MLPDFRPRILFASLALALSNPVLAESPRLQLDIAAQPLNEAVARLSREYDVVIISPAGSNMDIRLQPVSGNMTLAEALNQALSHTQLRAVKDDNGSIIITTSEKQPSARSTVKPTRPDGRQPRVEEVVVTAQKTVKNLQQVAAAVSSVSGNELNSLNIGNPFDMSNKVPGLVVSSVQGYRPTISIRGVGNEIPDNAGTKQAVAFHVDGVFMANDYALWADLFDIDRIEITRGPDGTLYGNSSTGGALNVITQKPDFTRSGGYAELALGTYQQQEFRGAFNMAVSPSVAIRLAASHRENKGYSKNLAIDGYRLDDRDNQTYKAQLSWQPNDQVSLLLQQQNFTSDTHGPALKGGFDMISDDPREVSHDTAEFYKLDTSLTSLHLDWQLDVANLNAVVSRQRYDMRRRLDFDRSSLTANDPAPLPLTGELDLLGEAPIPQFVGNLSQLDHSYTAEINLTSAADESGIQWVIGAFYLDTEVFSNTRNFYDADRDGNPVNEVVQGPNIFANNADIDFINSDYRNFNSYALFGQVTYPLSDKLNLTGGLRYTKNKFEDERCSLNCVPDRSPISSRPEDETDNITGKLAADYQWSDTAMSYFSVATGIKPAGSNSSSDTRFFPEVFDQERVLSYELGNKLDLWQQRLRINTAVFFYDYKDYLFESSGIGRFASGASNLPEAEIYGLELEANAFLTPSLTLDLNLSAMDSEITEGRDAIDRAEAENLSVGLIISGADTEVINAVRESTAIDLTGNKLAKIPDLTANLRLTHELALGNGNLLSSLGFSYRSEYYSRVFNSPVRDKVPSSSRYDMNIRYQPDFAQWHVELNVQNLFDKDDIASRYTDTFGLGFTSDQYMAPRTVTVRGRYHF
ncbi:TonB-dependent receptor domain-containing protein [Lacimicrobium alkaliphilum]|uniref:Secretin/TonB short N-terminal domain-containing protein n=1 Tax=Lacimicrobium alkaliphilum TaxID=1526571 RepID=A0ABQ1RKP0_9ALTE|nr:TonB-dependent receptor [Lacimicrobium alkaliphilum]GGD73365.1 hypothetical protein GCM10011357_30560 [Lacimicrobium alkaliphilum]